MTKRFLVAMALCFAALLALTGSASAAPVASFTVSNGTPAVNEVVHFDASASVCDPGMTCNYSWRAFGSGYSRLGTPIGSGVTLDYSWATARTVTVQLKVTANGSTNNFKTAQTYLVIS